LGTDSAASSGDQMKPLPLASAWGSTVSFSVLFLIYTLLKIRLSPKEITKHQALINTTYTVY